MMEGVEKIVIENNNPNMVFALFAIIAVSVIIVNLIGIKMKLKRRDQLEGVKRKIIKRHDSMETEMLRKRKEQENVQEGFGFSGRS